MTCIVYARTVKILVFSVFCNLLITSYVNCNFATTLPCLVNCSSMSNCYLRTKCIFGELRTNDSICSYTIFEKISRNNDVADESKLSNMYVWIYSLTSAFIISIAGIWGYLFLPLMTGAYRDHVMNVLVGLSFGSLVTSAICQLIPEAYEQSKIKVTSEYLKVALFSMLGMWLTWSLQCVGSIIGRDAQKPTTQINVEIKTKDIKSTKAANDKTHNGCSVYKFPTGTENIKYPVAGEIFKNNSEHDIPHKIIHSSSLRSIAEIQCLKSKASPKFSKLAIAILVGDFINNFMDGVSIGAGYSYYLSSGIKLTIAIVFEEYTHKLGDFAIVFQSGVPLSRVLFWNYTTSCGCFVGLIFGIILGNMNWSHYIFSFASGLFLFICLANMIPEMQNMLDDSLRKSKMAGLVTLLEQNCGFFLALILLNIISVLL